MNQLVKAEGEKFKNLLSQQRRNIMAALPSHISVEKFERVCLLAVQRNPDLLAPGVNKQSLFLACQRAAADGLLPDGREGALVLFGNTVQWMPMVAGLMKLARNSGEIASISAHVAYKGEKFAVILGDEERIEHERDLELSDGAEVLAVYAVAKLKNGETVREVMTKAQVEKVRNVSRAKNKGPWVDWWDEMAKKTVIRRLSKRLPLSSDRDADARLQAAAEREDADVDFSGLTLEATEQPKDEFEAASSGMTVEAEVIAIQSAMKD
jgi:recombination protein RecT